MSVERLIGAVAAMSDRPWRLEAAECHDPRLYAGDRAVAVVRHERDAEGILALVAHADVIVELLRAIRGSDASPAVQEAIAAIEAVEWIHDREGGNRSEDLE